MRLLLDTCVWGGAALWLRTEGHDVAWSGDWEYDPGDEEILARALADGRGLSTLDKDFGELASVRDLAHCGIIRLVEIPARDQGRLCLAALKAHQAELTLGAIVTVERWRTRVRTRPLAKSDPRSAGDRRLKLPHMPSAA